MKFRKKPVVIEAVQLRADNLQEVLAFTGGVGEAFCAEGYGTPRHKPGVVIKTLEGVMTAVEGDWVIRGVKGEFYPCKPDVFKATYEAADDEVSPQERPRVRAVYIFNQMVAVFDEHGEQVPELQGRWEEKASLIYARADAGTRWCDSNCDEEKHLWRKDS